jgi:alpha-L-rhamnosidase
MKITNLRVNHMDNPLGFLIGEPTFSWITSDSTGTYQEAAQLQIAFDEGFCNLFYDSGRQNAINSMAYTPNITLKPCTRYFWRVMVWSESDYGISDTAWFETAKGSEPWSGKWITSTFDKEVHPLFYKSFSVPGNIKSARIYVTGLGVYELEINGTKVGEEFLAPFYNDYHKWLQYQTYDITPLLQEGENAIGAMLGNGWYKGRFGFIDQLKELYGSQFGVLCEIDVTLEDNSHIIIGSDESWMCHPSPVLESSIYDGEVYDARKEVVGWSSIGCDLADYKPAKLFTPVCGNIMERLSPRVIITERRAPIALLHTPAKEQVIDFGQVMTGWVEFKCNIPAGEKVHIQFGELLQNDNFYNENLRSAKEEYIYLSNGKPAIVRPHFTFYGFRYAKVTGLSNINLEDFEACVIHSGLEFTGKLKTSNDKVNRLIENAHWSQRDNFLDVPTDCPQRDERMGWTGDAQVFCATASFNMYTPVFYEKFLYDMLLEQKTHEGSVPHVVPDILERCMVLSGNENAVHHGSCAWGDAATVIPWTMYLFYGDKALLRKQFENMTLWVDYIKKQDDTLTGGSRLWKTGFHFADWLALDNPDKSSSFGGTDCYYIASAYYYYSAHLTAKAARVLGEQEKAEYYEKLSLEVKKAIQKEYFTQSGRIAVDTQTAMVLALYMKLVPEEHKNRLVQDLKKKLDDNQIHLTTGFVGTYYLCQVLSEHGLQDYAYTLLLNEDFPSWIYEVNMGATTIWERWNSVLESGLVSDTGMNSMNHYAYGSIVEWMYRYMCGINPVESAPGFKEIIVKPQFDSRFDFVQAEYQSAAGLYKSSWKKTKEGVTYQITVPFNAKARFILPDSVSVAKVNGTMSKELCNMEELVLTAGEYEIVVQK